MKIKLKCKRMSETMEQFLIKVSPDKETALKYIELIRVAERLGVTVKEIDFDSSIEPGLILNRCTLKLMDTQITKRR